VLLECQKEIDDGGLNLSIPCYGVEIVREDLRDDRAYHVEKDRIESMTTYKYKVVRLIRELYEKGVSPIHLLDIAGPLADEWVEDFDDEINRIKAQ
jgi:phosphoribosylformimino-5-aminoimidazole carboxamide ribonucleotide (ProFAR) isomerase